MSNRDSASYKTWKGLRARCNCQSNKDYANYGGRGINVCERWGSFANFLADMGEKPKGMSLDRIDNNGNYEPSNCRWATPKQQRENSRAARMITHNGVTRSVFDWSKTLEIRVSTLHRRIFNYKWPIEKAFSKSDFRERLVEIGGVTKSVSSWAADAGVSSACMSYRLRGAA